MKDLANQLVSEDDTYDIEDPQACRHFWWLMVELDTQLSFLLGRCPSIDPSHNIPKPKLPEDPSEENDSVRDVLDFTEYMIEFLNHIHQDQNDRHSHWEARTTILQSELNKLHAMQSKLPVLPTATPSGPVANAIAQHQVDVHLVLIVLYCQVLRSTSTENTRSGRPRNMRKSSMKNHYWGLLKSLRASVDIFDHSYGLDPATIASSWPRCFGVFCAASMLGIARIRQDLDMETDAKRIERTLEIFIDLANAGQAPGVAQHASETLTDILDAIKDLEQRPSGSAAPLQTPHERIPQDEYASQPAIPRGTKSIPKMKPEVPSLKRSNTSNLEDMRAGKRFRTGTGPGVHENALRTPAWQDLSYSQATSLDDTTTGPKQEPTSSQGFVQQPYLLNVSTSFSDQMEYYEAGYVPTNPDFHGEYHPGFHWVHPPQLYRPPLYDDWLQTQFATQDNISPETSPQQGYYHPVDAAVQHQASLQGQQTSPAHAQEMFINASGLYAVEAAQTIGHPLSDSQKSQFFKSRARPHGVPAQVLSSPGEEVAQMERFPGAAQDRRRSVADVRDQQMGTWGVEGSAKYSGYAVRGGKQGDAQPQRRRPSPPQSNVPSPNAEYEPHTDLATLQQLQAQQSGNVPLTRRQSIVHMEGTAIQQPRHAADQLVRHQWQAQEQPGPYDMTAHIPYNATMTDEGVLRYNQQLQYHQQQHHIPTTVTTGPFTGDGHGQHWGWSG